MRMKRLLPPLGALLAFEAAARRGSFTPAGEELGLAQSAISRHIAQLERMLGLRLFERIRKQVVLTQAGANYAEVIRELLDRAEAATSSILGSKRGERVRSLTYLAAMSTTNRGASPINLDLSTIQQQELANTFRFHISQYLLRRAEDWKAKGYSETLIDWSTLNVRSKFWGHDQRAAF
jgi:DNA-binding transcriptional ArsR family regulator